MRFLMSNVRAVSNPFPEVVKAQLLPLHIVHKAASRTSDLAIQGRNLTLSQREPRPAIKAQLLPLHIVNNADSPTSDLAIQGRNLTLSQREPKPAIVVIPVSVQSNSNGLSTLTSEQPVEKPRNLVLAEVHHAFESLLESPSSPSLSRKSSVSELTQSSICSTAPDTPSKSGATGFARIREILKNESNQKKAFEKINKILATFKRY